MSGRDNEILPLAQPLTGREMETLTYIGDGLSNREIAEQMTVALSTVKWYVRQIYNKLGVGSRPQAIVRARQLGLLLDLEEAQRQRLRLPPQLTSFVGRQREIGEVRQLLMTTRLVTLTGPGGTGKTRLALEVAGKSAGQFVDGVAFVSLASITDPVMVPTAITQELGIFERPGVPVIDTLHRYFVNKELLLLVDNFEHLLDSASLLTELLTRAAQLSILATSREVLGLSGEYEYLVPPLSIPDLENSGSVADLSAYESVALFVRRAEAVSTHFDFNDENAAAVAMICRRLDGLPLAIELAAARSKIFSPQQLLERLESRLGLLIGGPRDVPTRQRTLRNTIDWSYNLLDEDEQHLFFRLGVFTGGKSLEAVDAICGPGLNIETQTGMESLLNKSLLYLDERPIGEPRFKMLETIQEYALERLAESGEESLIRERHLDFFLQMVEEAEPDFKGSGHVDRSFELEIEHDNLRAALEWSRRGEGRALKGLLLAGSLAAFWSSRSYFNEGRDNLSAALTVPGASERTAARAKALRQAGLLAYMQSDYPSTRRLLEESISIYEELGPEGQHGLADALITLGDMETEHGDYKLASTMMQDALNIMRQLNDQQGIARALWQLGQCAVRPGDFEVAVQYFEMALPLLRKTGDRAHMAIALSGLAEVSIRQGEYGRAAVLEEESLALRREIDETWGIAVSLGNFAWIALRQDDFEKAVSLLAESLTLRHDIGDRGGAAWCLEKLAEIALTRGERKTTSKKEDEFRRAALLFGAAKALRAPVDSAIDLVDQPEHERQLATVKLRLDEETFAAMWAEGGEMELEQVIEYCLT